MQIIENIKVTALILTIGMGALLAPDRVVAEGEEVLTVAGGCFWCVESDFEGVNGVREVVSGFTGGNVENPTYKQVVRGGTGHFEAVEITFDPNVITREELLHLFLRSIDVTDDGGQFCDRGSTYKTAIFVSNKGEKALSERLIAEAEAELGQSVVTPVLDLGPFYEADAYHQDFYKSKDLVLTRGGPKSKAQAYKFYRNGCRRDERIEALWGSDAPFLGH